MELLDKDRGEAFEGAEDEQKERLEMSTRSLGY